MPMNNVAHVAVRFEICIHRMIRKRRSDIYIDSDVCLIWKWTVWFMFETKGSDSESTKGDRADRHWQLIESIKNDDNQHN